jgi:hypothetical protein
LAINDLIVPTDGFLELYFGTTRTITLTGEDADTSEGDRIADAR